MEWSWAEKGWPSIMQSSQIGGVQTEGPRRREKPRPIIEKSCHDRLCNACKGKRKLLVIVYLPSFLTLHERTVLVDKRIHEAEWRRRTCHVANCVREKTFS